MASSTAAPTNPPSTRSPRIRVIALGLIKHGDRTFLSEGFDSVKQEAFYRSLGGGIDFGETSADALKREFQEEIQADLTNLQYLACVENIFMYEGKPGHEIIQLYQCDFVDPRFYQLPFVIANEGGREFRATWVAIDRFKSGELKLYPEICLRYL